MGADLGQRIHQMVTYIMVVFMLCFLFVVMMLERCSWQVLIMVEEVFPNCFELTKKVLLSEAMWNIFAVLKHRELKFSFHHD